MMIELFGRGAKRSIPVFIVLLVLFTLTESLQVRRTIVQTRGMVTNRNHLDAISERVISINRIRSSLRSHDKASPLPPSSPSSLPTPSSTLSVKDKVQNLWQSYGPLALTVYLGIYLTSFAIFYVLLDSQLLPLHLLHIDPHAIAQHLAEAFQQLTGSSYLTASLLAHPSLSTLLGAWGLVKLAEPVRIAATALLLSALGATKKREIEVGVGPKESDQMD